MTEQYYTAKCWLYVVSGCFKPSRMLHKAVPVSSMVSYVILKVLYGCPVARLDLSVCLCVVHCCCKVPNFNISTNGCGKLSDKLGTSVCKQVAWSPERDHPMLKNKSATRFVFILDVGISSLRFEYWSVDIRTE